MNTGKSDLMLAYGCSAYQALELRSRRTLFAKAVRHFGPFACYYHRKHSRWFLKNQMTTRAKIVRTFQDERQARILTWSR